MIRTAASLLACLLFALPGVANDALFQVAPASTNTLQLVMHPDPNDPLTRAARRAADDPYADGGTRQLLAAAHLRDEHALEQAFADDMTQAFREKAVITEVGFEYPPNPYRIPDGFGVVQGLANAVLRAKFPCGSIYAVDSIGGVMHGWLLICDDQANVYAIVLDGKNWKLSAMVKGRRMKPGRPK